MHQIVVGKKKRENERMQLCKRGACPLCTLERKRRVDAMTKWMLPSHQRKAKEEEEKKEKRERTVSVMMRETEKMRMRMNCDLMGMPFIAPAAFFSFLLWEKDGCSRWNLYTKTHLPVIDMQAKCITLSLVPLSRSIIGHRIHLAYCNDIPWSCLQITRKEPCTFSFSFSPVLFLFLSLSVSTHSMSGSRSKGNGFCFFHLLFNIYYGECTFISYF